MKNVLFKFLSIVLLFLSAYNQLFAQDIVMKKEISASEKVLIQQTFEEISRLDQLYRKPLSTGTLDEKILYAIDSVFDNEGIEAGIIYEKHLNLSLSKVIEDSLWQLQAAIDLRNHLTLRGLFDTYGFIPKSIVEEKQYVQVLLLLHPPKDWNVNNYLNEYSILLLEEVKAGRMPPKSYANFYDNMKGKILKEPQLYGTNEVFDAKTKTILPPIIENIKKTNTARVEIGLPALKVGEYRIL